MKTNIMNKAPSRNDGQHLPKWHISCLAAAILTSTSSLSLAQSSADSFSDMSLSELMGLEVFSAASRLPTKHSKAPGTVYSFERKDFSRFGVRRVEDLLQFVPGMQLNQYRKRHRSVWARGLLDRYNDKLILLVDGVETRHLYYGHFSLGDNFPIEKVEKVEIIMGPASSLYGANAFGGIISITTRSYAKNANIELTGEAGNHERKKVTGLANGSNYQVFASHLDQEAPFSENRKSFIGGDVVQPLDEQYSNLFAKASPIEGLTISIDYLHNDTPFLFIPDTQDSFVEERFFTLSARYQAGNVDDGKLEATVYRTSDYATEFEIENVTRTLGYIENQDAEIEGATLTGFKRYFENHIFALGFSWHHEDVKDTSFIRTYNFLGPVIPTETGSLLSNPRVVNDDYAVFFQDVWEVNPELNITLGARYDKFDQFDEHFNYRGAIVYTPEYDKTWKLLYGTAIRTPSLREYLKVLDEPDPTFTPPILDPERIQSLELAYLQQWQQADATITLFHNRVEDFIREEPTPSDTDEFFINSSENIKMVGIDTLFNYSPTDNLRLRLSTSYLDAESIATGKTPYLASWTTGFNLSYDYSSNHTAGFSAVHNNDRTDINTSSEDDPGSFITVNLFGSGRITKQLSYGFGIDNVFDKKIFDPAADFGNQFNTERNEREFWLQLKWSNNI